MIGAKLVITGLSGSGEEVESVKVYRLKDDGQSKSSLELSAQVS
jgi:hypothetical protein